MQSQLPELNINTLSDSDLVVYADRDVEVVYKVHSTISTRLVPSHQLNKSTSMKPFTHCVNKGTQKELECFVVKASIPDSNYPDYIISEDKLPYGYKG